ncbi:RagB/SusD family nutrient uptake outer membrane protein [Postechiella marina]|uniref:RagB/SusD family nutrient uptake outer membrane protein n=1 Tax=Postechiella marina TaxID=943941 RepID=A0ABP8CG62_9FLAO
MKKIFLIGLIAMLFTTACEDLEQFPPNIASADSLTDFTDVLNAAYYYQQGASTPMAVMGDFRADNMLMQEAPYTDFSEFNNNLSSSMEDQFFRPFYANLYKSILSANNVIENGTDATQIAEAKFLRGLSYFKLAIVFGDVPLNLSGSPSTTDASILARQPVASIYTQVVSDLTDALVLDNSGLSEGRASSIAVNALLGKVYVYMADFGTAQGYLEDAISESAMEGVVLESSTSNVLSDGNSEIIFATQKSVAWGDEYGFSEFTVWYDGSEDKAQPPLNPSLTAAFDAAGDTVRKALTIDEVAEKGVKYSGGLENDWIEIRLSDVILLLAETMNENNVAANTVLPLLDDIRTRAGLASLTGTVTSKDDVRTAILNERRLELAFEGQRWFDLVRTGTVDAAMGVTVNSNYYVFPIPNSEIDATNGVITQNTGY